MRDDLARRFPRRRSQVRAFFRSRNLLSEGGKATKVYIAAPLVLAILLLPALVPLGMALLMVKTLLELFGLFMLVNRERSLRVGFQTALAYIYKCGAAATALPSRSRCHTVCEPTISPRSLAGTSTPSTASRTRSTPARRCTGPPPCISCRCVAGPATAVPCRGAPTPLLRISAPAGVGAGHHVVV